MNLISLFFKKDKKQVLNLNHLKFEVHDTYKKKKKY